MNRYIYEGPVLEFNTCIANVWSGETVAVSEKKARCNLAYQFKKKYQISPNAKITLPGNLIRVG